MLAWVGRHWRVIIAVCGALVAAVLGAAVQEVLDSRTRVVASAALVVCVVAVALLATLGVMIDGRRQSDQDILTEVRDAVAEHRDTATATNSRIASLAGQLTMLSRSIGMKVDTMLLEELNTARTLDCDRTVQLMLTAREEIRILDLLLEDGRWPDEAMDQSYQANSLDAFLALLRRTSPPISYKRLIQVRDPAQSLRNARTPSLVKHCHDIMDLRRTRGSKVSLRVTRQRFPFKFIIIDRAALVLQLQEYGSDEEDLRIWGEVLVTDPGGQLVAVFRDIWDELIEDPSTRTVTLADLPPRDAVRQE